MMRNVVLALMVVTLFLTFAQPAMATTEGEAYPDVVDVTDLQPFTAETNYMSLPGYLRYEAFKADGVWMTRLEAVQAVKAQGADPTLSCRPSPDAQILNGCREPL